MSRIIQSLFTLLLGLPLIRRSPLVIAAWSQALVRLRMGVIAGIAVVFLTGCVQSEVGITIDHPHHGEIVQHLRFNDQLARVNGAVTQEWLKQIEQRAHQLGGNARRLSEQELVVTIPFHNGADLTEKFNQFFEGAFASPLSAASPSPASAASNLPAIKANLALQESNWGIVTRDRLSVDLDLRALGVLASDGRVLASPSSWFDLEFRLQTPWGARHSSTTTPLTSANPDKHQFVWRLNPGDQIHIEAMFWLPSPIGIGTLVIITLVVVGMAFKSLLSLPSSSVLSAPKLD